MWSSRASLSATAACGSPSAVLSLSRFRTWLGLSIAGLVSGDVAYSEKQYWEDAYTDGRYGESFEWLGDWNATGGMRDLLKLAGVSHNDRILHVGCGNSRVAVGLWEEGFRHVIHLDISEVVISTLASKLNFTSHKFIVGDMTALSFGNDTFDAVVDKGALDALFTGGKRLARSAVREIARVLHRSNGKYVMVSMGTHRLEAVCARADLGRMRAMSTSGLHGPIHNHCRQGGAGEPQRRLKDLQFPHASLSYIPQAGEQPTFVCEAQNISSWRTSAEKHSYICRRPGDGGANSEL